jgi:hypothetical protein
MGPEVNMAISIAFADTATIGTTEYSLPNDSTTLTPRTETGVFQVFIDTSAMQVGDQYEINVYEKVISGGSQVGIYQAVITGVMADSWVSPSLILSIGWDVTVKKLAGTDRSIGWSIRQVA